MRIRRCASRLLGGAAVASAPAPASAPYDPPQFELPLPPPPAPANQSLAGVVASEDSSGGEPCCALNQSPWDLMAKLDLSDPEAEELFEDTYFISPVWRASWLFPSWITMPALSSIKEKKMAAKSKPKTNKGMEVKKGVWTCKKNDVSKKPHRKRSEVDVGDGFYYYAGFGPSRSTKRQCRSSGGSSVPEEPPLPAEQQKEEAPSETKNDFSASQSDGIDHQVSLVSARAEETRMNDSTIGIPGCDEESSDDEALGWNGEQYCDITKRKSPFKKRWRKPVKARSLKSLMSFRG